MISCVTEYYRVYSLPRYHARFPGEEEKRSVYTSCSCNRNPPQASISKKKKKKGIKEMNYACAIEKEIDKSTQPLKSYAPSLQHISTSHPSSILLRDPSMPCPFPSLESLPHKRYVVLQAFGVSLKINATEKKRLTWALCFGFSEGEKGLGSSAAGADA